MLLGDLISDSPAAVSNEKSYFGAVGAPTEVKWADDSYTATWSAGQEAENADGYIITLYKGANVVPTELGTIKTTSVDLSAYMTEVGDYTFEVVAVGKSTTEGKYLDSPAAKSTVAKRVAKALEPVEITDWTDRVVTWTDTNANTNKVYEVKLYKGNETTPVLEDTIHETTIDFDDYDENMISEGEYTVEITAKGDNTYYYDSTAVTKTQSFLSRLAKPTGLAWDDTKAVWDDVSSANGYVVSLWFNGVATGIEYSVMNSEYDFASDLQLPGDYTFKVVANATATHTASAEAVSPVKTNDVTRNGNIYIKLYEDAECTIEKTEFAAGDTIYAAITLQSNESTPLEITTLAVPIKFNPAYLQVEAITAGDMLAGFTNAPGYPYYDNEIGLAAIAAYTTEAYTVSAETEEIVAVVTLKATLKSDDLTLTYAAANDQGDPYDEAILSGAEFALADQALFVNENDVVFDVVVGPLPKMETPVWSSSNATLITWEKYDNDELNSVVSGYEIQILKDGVAYGSPIVVEGVDTNNKNLSSYMTTSGSYTVKIRALSNNEEVALDGNEYSDPSAAYTKRSGGGMGSSSTATVTPDDKKDETDKPDTPVTPVKPEFTDIKGHWAEADILELVDLGIVDGYGDNTFRPDLGITRAEFTKLMITCLGLELEEDGYVYDDTKNHWAKNYIALGTKIGIVNGIGDNLFDPDTVITREQIAAIIWRMAGKVEEVGVSQFTDRDEVTEYAKTAVDYVAANGIMIGFEDNTYRGTEKTNRAQMATVVLRLIKANFFENYNK